MRSYSPETKAHAVGLFRALVMPNNCGTAKVTNGEETYLVTENESTYIPIGQVHALENPGAIPWD